MIKTTLLAFVLILGCNHLNAQKITKLVDSLEDKAYWTADETPIYSDDGVDGFRTSASFKYNAATPILTGFSIKVGGWNCLEKVALIILFEDGEKINLTSWNDFNCKGNAYYTFSRKDLEKLSTKPIKKIRINNSRDYQNTYTFDSPSPNYFLDVIKNIESGEFETKEM